MNTTNCSTVALLCCSFSKVIHAVGPVWDTHERTREELDALLASAVKQSLVRADELECESIAFPGISSGIFGFPVDRCARVMLTAAHEYFCKVRQEQVKGSKADNEESEDGVSLGSDDSDGDDDARRNRSQIKRVRFVNIDEKTSGAFAKACLAVLNHNGTLAVVDERDEYEDEEGGGGGGSKKSSSLLGAMLARSKTTN
jgi:O-acetyl-ADP-ribose deacetylase (regulator of RNase III)